MAVSDLLKSKELTGRSLRAPLARERRARHRESTRRRRSKRRTRLTGAQAPEPRFALGDRRADVGLRTAGVHAPY
jgi:hypothetical protein